MKSHENHYPIDKEILRYCTSTRNRYRSFLGEKKSSKKIKKGGESKKESERNVALLEGERYKLDALEKCINKNGNELMICPKTWTTKNFESCCSIK